MGTLRDTIRREVEDQHAFITGWFNGTVDRTLLDARFMSRLHPDLIYVSPEGTVLQAADLRTGFELAHGSNPDFRIQIRDVKVRFEAGDQVLATYTEWQVGARNTPHPNNGRFVTVLMRIGEPISWLHLQETWVPDDARAADPFGL